MRQLSRILYFLGLIIVINGRGTVIHAQPPEVPGQTAPATQRQAEREAMERIAQVFNKPEDLKFLAVDIVGHPLDAATLTVVEQEIRRVRGNLTLEVNDISVERNPDGQTASVMVGASLKNYLLSSTQYEKLSLRHQEDKWLVVPGDPKQVFADPQVGTLLRLATLIAEPQASLQAAWQEASAASIKQLEIGLLQFLEDTNHKFTTTPETFAKDIQPYLGSDQLFYSPADKSGNMSYRLNTALIGRTFPRIQHPDTTVMVYEGHDGELSFVHNGRAVVGFADGHVMLVDQEQAKTLRWKP
ncbi:MAG: hypothetical protein JO316_17225 [Abitibacteriaceae bacterium]|nr:hypothetical protein [Abditibacteriaceae bacterium]